MNQIKSKSKMKADRIAYRVYKLGNSEVEVTASIFTPVFIAESQDWECHISIAGGEIDIDGSARAVDSLQALVLAVNLLKTEIKLLPPEALNWFGSINLLCGLEKSKK